MKHPNIVQSNSEIIKSSADQNPAPAPALSKEQSAPSSTGIVIQIPISPSSIDKAIEVSGAGGVMLGMSLAAICYIVFLFTRK